jgi:hypothetical protein
MEEILEEDNKSKNTNKSKPSMDSIQELSKKTRKLFSISLIIINIISFILGIYILYYNNYYLNPDYKFSNQTSLYIFIILYTSGMLSALFISFLFSLIMKLIQNYKNNNNSSNNNDKSQADLINNEDNHTRLSIFILNDNQNNIALIPFAFSYFIVFTIAIYFIALPYSFILIIKLFQNKFLCKVFSFFFLYFFMIINLFAGLIMVLLLFYIVFGKKRINVRKQQYNIDNSNLENIRNEVRNAMK